MCGDYSCALIARYESLGLVNLLLIYLPFFKVYEKQELESEQEVNTLRKRRKMDSEKLVQVAMNVIMHAGDARDYIRKAGTKLSALDLDGVEELTKEKLLRNW